MGLFGLPFPEEFGGMGGDYFALCLALEELARVDSSVAITLEAAGAEPIRLTAERVFNGWLAALQDGLVARGLAPAHAERRALHVLAAVEGALLLARARRDLTPLRAVRDELVGLTS